MAPGLIEHSEVPQTSPPSKTSLECFSDPEYIPNVKRYRARTAARLGAGTLQITVPTGWPTLLEVPLCWDGAQFADEHAYVYSVTADDKIEVEEALTYFKELELNGEEVNRTNFPLRKFGDRLRSFAVDVNRGKGFCVIRGIDPKAHSLEDSTVIFLGISSYIGERRGRQDRLGNMLIHVMDAKPSRKGEASNPRKNTHTTEHFHNDIVPDVLALWTRSCAARGGGGVLASSWEIYNRLALTRPDLIHVLASPNWPIDNFGDEELPYQNRPLLFHQDGKIILNFSRYFLTGRPTTPRTKGIPSISEAQAEALDALHFTARKCRLETSMKPGDMRFINNLALLHSREPYQDDNANTRHLVRMWLRNDELGWEIPPPLKGKWDQIFHGDPDLEDRYAIVPLPDTAPPLVVQPHEGCYF